MRRPMRPVMFMLSVLAALALWLPGRGQATGRVTTILTVETATATYGETVSVQATLTDADTGAGIARKLISFLVGGQFRQAVTDASGVATLSNQPLGRLGAGTYPGGIQARFDGLYGPTVYEASTGAGDLVVGRRPLRVVPLSIAREYGDENPASLPYRLENFAFADDERALTSPPTCTTAAARSSGVGTYAIICGGLAAPNYEGEYSTQGVLTVTPAPMAIRPHNQVKRYGQPNAPFAVTYEGAWKLGEGPDVLAGVLKCGSAGASRLAGVGAYPIVCGGQSSQNYALKYAEGVLRVAP